MTLHFPTIPWRWLVPLVASLVLLGAADARIWTDASGTQQVEAEYVTCQFGKIWLLRSDGRVFGVDPKELSTADQQYVLDVIRQRKADRKPTANPPGCVPYGSGRELCRLKNPRINESSGLACSRRYPGFFWTHNDSGADARIYLFDAKGNDFGSCRLEGVFAYDFEDMFSFQQGDKSYLVVGDVGNNGRAAPVLMLYVIEEPHFDPKRGLETGVVPVLETIYYSYEDDHRDCEAVALDPTNRTLVFVTKERASECFVYTLRWPSRVPEGKALTARRIATLKLPAVTAMDISPDGRRAVVLTYASAYEFARAEREDWSKAFARPPREIVVPERVQGESICYGLDGRTLYLTSERVPTPLIEVPVLEGGGP